MPGLTQAQALQLVKQGLGFRTDNIDAAIMLMFDVVQEQLEQGTTLPWFLQSIDECVGTAVGTAPLPVGFIRNVDDGGVYWVNGVDGRRRFLIKRPYDWFYTVGREVSGSESEAGPTWYILIGGQYRVWPIPELPWSVMSRFYKKQAAISTLVPSGQNEWLENAGSLVTSLCGLRMAEDLEHQTAVQKFQGRVQQAQARLLAESAEREISDREYVMGSLV